MVLDDYQGLGWCKIIKTASQNGKICTRAKNGECMLGHLFGLQNHSFGYLFLPRTTKVKPDMAPKAHNKIQHFSLGGEIGTCSARERIAIFEVWGVGGGPRSEEVPSGLMDRARTSCSHARRLRSYFFVYPARKF